MDNVVTSLYAKFDENEKSLITNNKNNDNNNNNNVGGA